MCPSIPRWSLFRALCFVVALCLGGCAGPPLEVTPLGCAVLHGDLDGGSCDLPSSRNIRLLIVTSESGELQIRSEHGEIPASVKKVSNVVRLVHLTVPLAVSMLTIEIKESWFRRQAVRLALRAQTAHEAPWLTQAREQLEAGEPDRAELILRKQAELNAVPGTLQHTEWQAIGLGLLAKIAVEGNRPDALSLLDRAIDASKRGQLLSLVSDYVLQKSWLLSKHQHRFNEAEAVLLEEQQRLDRVPEDQLWAMSQRALMRRQQGDLSGALQGLEVAEALMQRLDDDVVRAEIFNQLGTTLIMMGRMKDAEQRFAEARRLALPPCRRGPLLNTQGYTLALAQQTLRPSDPLRSRFEPRPLLEEAAALLAQCKIPVALSNVFTNLAHVAAAEQNFTKTEQWLKQAKEQIQQPDAELDMEWEDLAGQLSLWRREFAEAEKHYRRLGILGGRQNAYESVWLSLIGRARAQEASNPARAIDLYRKAESYLDQRSIELPLGAGRGTFLGRFERGTAHYTDLLVRQGDVSGAVEVARHARARGLLALGMLARADVMLPAARQRWDLALARYREARRELDEIVSGAADDAETQRSALKREQKERVLKLNKLLEEGLRSLGSEGENQKARQAEAGELMLFCYPQSIAGWHCFAWDQQGPPVHRVIPAMDAPSLGLVLGGVSEKLSRAHRLSVIAYGEQRDIDVHLLHLPGHSESIDEKLEVVYALDLPGLVRLPDSLGAAHSPGKPDKKALLVFDPQGRLPQSRRAAEPVGQALRRSGWQVVMQTAGVPRVGDYAGKPVESAPLSGEQLRTLLPGVLLFHYGGHGEFDPVGGWSHKLRVAEGLGLLVGDIATLRTVPERVLLFGCSTGQSAEESGGIEGLGLAQAFVLRGSRFVIATVRTISDRLAAEVAVALYSMDKGPQGIAGDHPDPAILLREVRRKLLSVNPDPERVKELGAFRVFVP